MADSPVVPRKWWNVKVEKPCGGSTIWVHRTWDEATDITKREMDAGALSVQLTPWEDALAE